ncbi:MAG: arginine repressor [Candidatus Merdivicinus sp.]|jgi:transcriptional regulator of arginine metabolism
MKALRLAKIIELVEKHEIYTQEDLLVLLAQEGFVTTQATISRDIKELSLIKTVTEDGKYKYTTSRKKQTDNMEKKFRAVFMESVISVDYALNTVVIKCHNGMANAACASLDTMAEMEGIVGTLAGDDTIFVLMRTEELAGHLTQRIQHMIAQTE